LNAITDILLLSREQRLHRSERRQIDISGVADRCNDAVFKTQRETMRSGMEATLSTFIEPVCLPLTTAFRPQQLIVASAADVCRRLLANSQLDAAIEVNICGIFDVHHPPRRIDTHLRRCVHG
jgi:hypothetical protein